MLDPEELFATSQRRTPPWPLWTNGKTHRVTVGDERTRTQYKLKSLRVMLYKKAKELDLSVETMHDREKRQLVFRFVNSKKKRNP